MFDITDPRYAREADAKDELRPFRERFHIPAKNGKEQVYFLGNSLGLQPRCASDAVRGVLEQWSNYGVAGFTEGDRPWLHFHDHLTGPLAGIVGGLPAEITVMNQLTVNLHLMMASFYRPAGKRKKIICEAKAFSSDQYAIETHLRHLGLDPAEDIIEIAPREGEHLIRHADILEQIEQHASETALVLWGGVNYYTGQLFDIAGITAAAHAAGAMAGFDLAHAAGNVPLQLHDWDVDFACWCSYKYLNSGPGAVAGAFIHERYHNRPGINRLAGWWGYEKATRFQMKKGFRPVAGAEGWQLGTPPVVLLALHLASLEIFHEAGMEKIAAKGAALSDYLIALLNDIRMGRNTRVFEIITPQKREEKGCQVSVLTNDGGKEIFDGLADSGIFADWREPGVIRVAPVPLYNSFEDVWRFSEAMKKITT